MAHWQALLSTGIGWTAKLLNAIAWLTPVRRHFGIAYGSNPRHKLDLYEPWFSRKERQTIVFFYGGGWTSGSRFTYRFVGAALALRGFRVVIPDYRLHPEATLPQIMQDAADAVAWATRSAPEQALFLSGHSVGAYIAVTLAAEQEKLAGQPQIKGVIGIAGPYLPMSAPKTARLPPALLIAAADDRLVPSSKTEQLASQWSKAGPVEVRLYHRGGHALLIGAVSPLLRWAVPVLRDLSSFTRDKDRGVQPAE